MRQARVTHGYFTLTGHGDVSGISGIENEDGSFVYPALRSSVDKAVDAIIARLKKSSYKGQNIQLNACEQGNRVKDDYLLNYGNATGGLAFAQRLADRLGVIVIAPYLRYPRSSITIWRDNN